METVLLVMGFFALIVLVGGALVTRYVDNEFSKWCDAPRRPTTEEDMAKKKGRGGKPGC